MFRKNWVVNTLKFNELPEWLISTIFKYKGT